MMRKHWPIELISHILCRLPAKSVIRFKSVSKEWSALTQDSYFIKSHLQQASTTNNGASLLLVCSESSHSLYSVDLDSFDHVAKQDLPTKISNDNDRNFKVLGSCNGLVLVLAKSEANYDHLLLWNISTQDYRILPIPPSETPVDEHGIRLPSRIRFYGFGYDSTNDDYKVLRIQLRVSILTYAPSPIYGPQVYSLRSNAWTKVGKNPYSICYRQQPRALSYGGALHWLAAARGFPSPSSLCSFATLIVAFDLGTGECLKVPLLEDGMIGERKHFLGTLGVLGGCLCVTNCPSRFYGPRKFTVDIWVMKDYMVKESWTKLFSIIQYENCPVKPLAYSKNAEDNSVLLLQDNDKVSWYNHKTGKKVEINHGLSKLPKSLKAQEICLRTLVSLSAYGDGRKRPPDPRQKQPE